MSLQYLLNNWNRVLSLAGDHLQLTLISIFLALAVAMPLSLAISRRRELALPIIGALGAFYTVPSLALLAILIPFLGLGRLPAVVALAAYAQLFLVRNTVAGLWGVDAAAMDAARGMGMSEWQQFSWVQFPMALPVILAGIRVALVTTISLATVTAWINAGGLGLLLFDGITRDNPSQILAGTVAVTALALGADFLMRLLERQTAIARSRRAAGGD